MEKIENSILESEFMPHGFCFLWRPEVIWLHAISDIVIALAYFTIPITIAIILYKKKKDIPFVWVFGMFATFIFFCGLTHIIGLISIWRPIYYIEGLVKVLTAAVSLATAIIMFPLIPVIVSRFEQLEKLHGKNKEN